VEFLRRHRVAFFFVLAYVLAWGAIPWNSFFAPGALLAAVIVVSITEGVAGLKRVGARLIRWRVSWIWYLLAFAVPLGVHAGAVLLNLALGASPPSLALLSPAYALPLALGMHILSPFGGPLMEEPSFRGFAQPELQRTRSPLTATAIMAFAIAGWHLPLFVMGTFGAHPIGLVTTFAVSFWYAWLFNRASGSSLLTLIAHGVEGGVLLRELWGAGADLERLHWTYAIAWCLVVLALLVFDRRFWVRPPEKSTAPNRARTRQEV
jgi:uncharacterized protein